MPKEIDLRGRKFGALTPLIKQGRTPYKKIIWLCQCDCGKKTKANSGHLLSGARVSCGCRKLNRERYRLDIKDVCCQYLLKQYEKNSKRYSHRIKEFKINVSDIKEIVFKNCTYCNKPPFSRFNPRRKSPTQVYEQYCLYNGIDRVNSDLGYIKENCVTCCARCNVAKNDMTLDEFKSWIIKTYKFYIEGI